MAEQETAIVNMVLENNAITIKQIQSVVDCTGLFSIVCSVQKIYTSSCVCCDVQAIALLAKHFAGDMQGFAFCVLQFWDLCLEF